MQAGIAYPTAIGSVPVFGLAYALNIETSVPKTFGSFVTGIACKQGLLTLRSMVPSPFSGLAYALNIETSVPRTCRDFSDILLQLSLDISSIPL